MPARLLAIALDGADAARLAQWSDDGSLPHLAALRRGGITTPLEVDAGTTDDSLWASFQYGEPVGEHGRYNYLMPLSTGRLGMAFVEEEGRETFWRRLATRGLRSAILDMPKSAAPGAFDGIHLADWLVHGRYFHEPCSFPPALAHEVIARFGPAPPSICDYHQPALDDAAVREIVGNLLASVTQKRAAALHHMAAEAWDLFFIGFKEGHCAGHGLWNLADASHPEFDASRSARLGWPLKAIFTALDTAVGDLVAAAGPDAAIVVFTTSEMAPNGTLTHLMPAIVERIDAPRSGWAAVGRLVARSRPRCTILPHGDNCVGLRVTGGRGDEERARYRARLGQMLSALVDADTGRPVIAAITYPSAEQGGARAASLPDLLVHAAPGLVPRAVVSPATGGVEAAIDRRRPGNHAGQGLWILHGAAAVANAAGLATMQDFEAFAARVLAPPTAPSPDAASTIPGIRARVEATSRDLRGM